MPLDVTQLGHGEEFVISWEIDERTEVWREITVHFGVGKHLHTTLRRDG